MTKKPTDLTHQRIVLGTNAGGALAVDRARQTGTPLVVWRDGRVQEVSPDNALRSRDAKTGEFVPHKDR